MTDSGVGIGGGGPRVCLVCSLSMLGGVVVPVFTTTDTVWYHQHLGVYCSFYH